ncbi:MAG: hypothetical protein ACRCWF_11380 [Beijerinckiaceae bacterium]
MSTWVDRLGVWIKPKLIHQGLHNLQNLGEKDLCFDDPTWEEIIHSVLRHSLQETAVLLGNALYGARLKTFHGCCTKDAGAYHSDGIRVHNRAYLVDQVRKLVAEEDAFVNLRKSIDQTLQSYDANLHDEGRVYVVLDAEGLTKRCGHYVLYGSEWMQGLLGSAYRSYMKENCTPTILEVGLPLSDITEYERNSLAQKLILEWVRITVNKPIFIPTMDFGFCLRRNIPSHWILSHYHPETIIDPINGSIKIINKKLQCPHCNQSN